MYFGLCLAVHCVPLLLLLYSCVSKCRGDMANESSRTTNSDAHGYTKGMIESCESWRRDVVSPWRESQT
eukprot:6174240-Pleurochrysis_carterae.AAC.2